MTSTTLNTDSCISINAILQSLPGLAFVKSIDSRYVSANSYSAHLYGFKDADQLSGHNDYELKSSIVESADIFRQADKQVMTTGQPMSYIHAGKYINDEIHIFSVKKAPIKNSAGDIVGISCIANEISSPEVGRAIFKFSGLEK
jgi:PAS domain-containing protein